MGGNPNKPKNLHYAVKTELQKKLRLGVSKYDDKKSGEAKNGIYSTSTARTYNKMCQEFADFVIQKNGSVRISIDDSRQYAEEYLQENLNNGKSVYTVKSQRSALAKLYGCEGNELCELPDRSRTDITRSRNRTVISPKTGKEIKNPSTRAGRFSEKKHQEIVDFCRSSGLRRHELETLTGDQLRIKSDGSAVLDLHGTQCKGGRPRTVPLIGNVESAITLCVAAGNEKVFPTVPSAMDVHHYRSQYATALYHQLERPIDSLERSEQYICRGDLKGVIYDREAMANVSNALGHNRINVIAEHYLR